MKSRIIMAALSALFCLPVAATVYFSGNADNDLYRVLVSEGVDVVRYDTPGEALENADNGSGLIVTSPGYPAVSVKLDSDFLKTVRSKNLRLYAEYVGRYPGIETDSLPYHGKLERGVVTSDFFRPGLSKMDIIGLNDCYIIPAKVDDPLLVYAKVAGFDNATYGLTDTDVYPMLCLKNKHSMLAFTCLSQFKTARFEPVGSWKTVWTSIMRWLTRDKHFEIAAWSSDPQPSYGRNDALPDDARIDAVRKGADWLWKGRLLIHPSWRDSVYKYQGDGLAPVGPPPALEALVGDGAEGVLEGHCSEIYYDGSEKFRYWLRADVQGEVAFLLASAADLLKDKTYADVSERVLDYLFYSNSFINGNKKTPGSPAYGLIGWSKTHDYVYYNDDNARCVLGAIGASALLNNYRWNEFIVNCIMANFRLSSRQGFLPDRIEDPDLMANGVSYYADRDFILPHPHFDSWMWACYLWLYDKTGYRPLLEKAETAIRTTMDAYPDKWLWTNGIQQERARMVLPLAWLVRVDDTPEHRRWLDTVVKKLLENQDESGAIREELGSAELGVFGKPKSNKDYGVTEAPLIEKNGDPVSDMLYTCNFAFFALNEAAQATGDSTYKDAVNRLSDFLVRIQARSESHPDLDGAWMRAFNYKLWDYWASNADSGWGAWSTLTGWIQSWIVGTQALVEKNTSYWDVTRKADVSAAMSRASAD